MSSLVHDLQNDIRRSDKSVTEILRTAKLISAKLGLTDISEWLDSELNGYRSGQSIPAYRLISSGNLQIRNPVLGWQALGSYDGPPIPLGQAVTELLDFAEERGVVIIPPQHIPVTELSGMDHMVNQFDQRVIISGSQFVGIIEAVKNKVLEWTIELVRMHYLTREQTDSKGRSLQGPSWSCFISQARKGPSTGFGKDPPGSRQRRWLRP